MNDVSRKTCKNLEAAVAASKNPGDIFYYQPPEEMKKLVDNKTLQKLHTQNLKLQQQIDALDAEIQERERRQMNAANTNSRSIQTAQGVSTLSQVYMTTQESENNV